MKKLKWLFGLCLMMLVVCGSGVSVQASDVGTDSETDVSDFRWTENDDGTVTITGYIGTDETVVIPSKIEGKRVSAIGYRTFKNYENLEAISLPYGLENISSEAFYGCHNLIDINIPNTVKKIGASAFRECLKLQTIELSDNLMVVDKDTFWGCKSLSTVKFPEKLTIIEDCAFIFCENLQSVILPEGLTTINYEAFGACSNLTNISIPDTVTEIGNGAFTKCKIETLNLPKGLSIINEGVFGECKSLKSINIPDSVKSIERDAFYVCSSLKSINIPDGVETIGDYAFAGCTGLTNINISSSVTTIRNRAFLGCKSLKKIVIPDGVRYIWPYAFQSCIEKDGILYVSNSFSNIDVTIYANPNSYARTYAEQIGIKFSCLNTHDWDKGVVVTEATALKDGQKIYTCTACNTKRTEKVAKLGLPKKGKSITEAKTNSTYKVTKSAAKNGTVELAKVNNSKSSITIPDTVTVDGVTYKVTSVSKNVFKNNKKLKKVTIGKNITQINTNTFYGCKNLKTITIKSTNLKSVGKNAFKGIHSKASIKVPKSKLSKYKKFLKGKGQQSTVKITK